ncbi:glycoside hydrolase family 57 protein [Clostridium sp. DL1XJH146]
MKDGYVSLVLHSHLPFVRHPDEDDALEERWLFEAINESYIPLISIFDKLLEDKIEFKVTMSITPTLMSMLEDEYLNKKYFIYLINAIKLAREEIDRTKYDKNLNELAKFYYDRFNKILSIYDNYEKRLMNAFRKFDKLGCLEVITCSATHGLLPLLTINKETVKAQINIGVDYYTEIMGHKPTGIWLPECAYTYGIEEVLKDCGIQYFIGENISVMNASPKPVYGTYAPIVDRSGVCVFGRDVETSHQVWSSKEGYPGNYSYREFYKDIGYELDYDYIAPYIQKEGIRVDTGIKYHRITGDMRNKEYYNRAEALEKTKEHALHFMEGRSRQISEISKHMNVKPIITCPYDTELFGHWWFEGPEFLGEFIRFAASKESNFELITPSEYLKLKQPIQMSAPSPSTWGENGDYRVWLNDSNFWIYKDIHECALYMKKLANLYNNPDKLLERALNQAARELLLAESSDWPFIITNKTAEDYAIRRVNLHIQRFYKIWDQILRNKIDDNWLESVEELDNIFENIDYRIYRG